MNKDYYTVKEAANILKIKEPTVRAYLSTGILEGDWDEGTRVIKHDVLMKYKKRRDSRYRI